MTPYLRHFMWEQERYSESGDIIEAGSFKQVPQTNYHRVAGTKKKQVNAKSKAEIGWKSQEKN